MRKIFLILLTTLAAGTLLSGAGSDGSFKYSRISDTESEIVLTINEFKVNKIESGGMNYSKIVFSGGVSTNLKGYAELPYLSAAVQLLNNNNISLSYVINEYEEIELSDPLLPSRGIISRSMEIDKIPFEIDPASLKDEFYPGKTAETSEPFIFRDTRGINVVVYPFQYNAAERTLKVCRKITLKLSENGSETINPLQTQKSLIVREMEPVYRSLYINYNESKVLQVGDSGEILVIYTHDNGGLSAIQPYIDWKRQLGFTVSALEVPGGTDLDAAKTIQDSYDANNNILFVQLVGDWANLQSRFEFYSETDSDGSEDPVLGHVAGRDEYQDVIIGRFSVQNEIELANQISKSMNYEKNPETNGDWYTKALGIASNEGAGAGDDGESDEEHNEIIINNKLLTSSYTSVNTCYQADGANSAGISNYINQGVSLINYTGHGYYQEFSTPRFTNLNVNALTNGSKLPLVISVACLVGHLNYYADCFAEAWLKKTDGGAVAGWFSSISQPWIPPMRGQDYFNDILTGGYNYDTNPGSGFSTTERRITFGALTVNAAVLTLAEAPLDASTLATIETWTLFGDAALMVRTEKPVIVENMNETIFIENYSTKIMSDGQPLEGVLVTLFQDGSVYSAESDHNGDVSLNHTFLDGNVILTVSGYNIATIQKELPVQEADGPYLIVNGYSFTGNNYGSTAYGSLQIKNAGSEISEGATVVLATENKYIHITDGEELFGNIVIDSAVSKDNCFTLDISPNTPDGEVIKLNTVINDSYSKKIYYSSMSLTVNSPKVEATHSFNTESALQGQDQEVTFRLENKGHADLTGITAELVQISSYDILISEAVEIDSINSGDFIEVSFVTGFGSTIANSSFVQFQLVISSDIGFTSGYDYSVVVGMTENFESGDLSLNPWVLSGDRTWETDGSVSYEGEFSARSGEVLDGESATASLSFDYISDGSISFYRKVSSELVYDRLNFYIDGALIKTWSGEIDWAKMSYNVSLGHHVFSWSFTRDSSMGGGQNCAWIDNILATGISTTGIEDQHSGIPSAITLYQNYPNPFNPSTQIKFSLDKISDVSLNVYNISGQLVSELLKGSITAGIHSVEFDGSRLNSGIYYYTLEAGGISVTKKFVLMK